MFVELISASVVSGSDAGVFVGNRVIGFSAGDVGCWGNSVLSVWLTDATQLESKITPRVANRHNLSEFPLSITL